jgi:hypothetical protein
VVDVKKPEAAVPFGIVKSKRCFQVSPGRKQLPNMECAGADNPVSYHRRATVVLFLRKAQEFIRHCKRRKERGSRRVKRPLPKKHGKELLGLTNLHSSRALTWARPVSGAA